MGNNMTKSKMPPKKAGASDHFQTKEPDKALDCLLKYVPKSDKIWCCSAGEGRMVNYMIEQGYDVTGTDILQGFDFIDPLSPRPQFDRIIENTPYSIKDKWLEMCFSLNKPFALLMPITALGEQKRVKMYKKEGIQVLLPEKRLQFIPPNGEGSGSWFYAAWFCSGFGFPQDIMYE